MAKSRNVVIFCSLLAAMFIIWSMNLLKVRDNSITGQVISETGIDKTNIAFVFVLISVVAASMFFLAIKYNQESY